MEINYKGQKYALVSKEESLKVKAIDADRPKTKSDIDKTKRYALALKVTADPADTIKSVKLNGEKLEKIDNNLYGIKENKGGTIKIDVYKKYLCSVYDPILRQTTNVISKREGSEVEILNIVPDGYVEKEVTVIDGRTDEPISAEEHKKLFLDIYYENHYKTAYITFKMPSFPITLNHVYEKANEKSITVDTDEINENIFSCPRNFSYVKSDENVYYLPNKDIRFDYDEKINVVILTKEKENIDLIINKKGNKYENAPAIEKREAMGNVFYKYTFSNIEVENADDIRVIKK